jgi:hypothetical protein
VKKSLTIFLFFCAFNSTAQKAFFGSHNNEVTKVVQSQLAATLISLGLIQNLDANNSTSYGGTGNTWTDIAGSNHGNIVGGTFTTSGGVSFFNFLTASVASYVSAPVAKSTSMTFNIWAKANSVPVPGCMLFNTGLAGTGPDLFLYASNVYWNVWDAGGTPFLNASSVVVSNTTMIANTNWHNYTVVVDATSNNTKLYFDGIWKGTSAYKSSATSSDLYIGSAGLNDTGWNWIGGISSFQTYSRALTATEVNTNFNAMKSRFGY